MRSGSFRNLVSETLRPGSSSHSYPSTATLRFATYQRVAFECPFRHRRLCGVTEDEQHRAPPRSVRDRFSRGEGPSSRFSPLPELTKERSLCWSERFDLARSIACRIPSMINSSAPVSLLPACGQTNRRGQDGIDRHVQNDRCRQSAQDSQQNNYANYANDDPYSSPDNIRARRNIRDARNEGTRHNSCQLVTIAHRTLEKFRADGASSAQHHRRGKRNSYDLESVRFHRLLRQ